MKNTIKVIAAGCIALALLCSCRTEKVMTFEPVDCVFFQNVGTTEDTLRFAFGLLPDPTVESAVFTAEVNIAGTSAPRDREFYVDVLKDAGNPQTRYEIITPSVLKAGETVAGVEIRLWRTPNLDTTRDTVTVVLRGSADLIADLSDNTTRCITFYNPIDMPSWWTKNATHLGRYHEIKLQVLQIVLGSMEDPVSDDAYAWAYYQVILNDYCADNDVRYPDDNKEVRFANGY